MKIGRNRKLKAKQETAPVAPPLRYIVKAEEWESEVIVQNGVIETADDPLEDYVGDPWDALADHARAHGWKVRDKDAQAGEPPQITKLGDGTTVIVDEFAKMEKALQAGKTVKMPTVLPVRGAAGGVLVSNPSGGGNGGVTWMSSADEIEKQLKAAMAKQADQDAQIKRLEQEYAVRQAQSGNIDAMNAAIFPPTFTRQQEAAIERRIAEEVERRITHLIPRIAAEVARYLNLPDRDTARAHAAEVDRRMREMNPLVMMKPGMDWDDSELRNWKPGKVVKP